MRMAIASALLALASCATLPATGQDRSAQLLRDLHDPNGRVMVTAHRACWGDAPENSLAAIRACRDLNVDIVELDIRLSADGVPVLSHDRTLKRMAGVSSDVASLTAAQLSSLKLRNRNGRGNQVITAEGVPTLEQALAEANGRVLVILDLKGPMPETAERATEILRRTGNCPKAMFAWVAPPERVQDELGSLMECAAYIPNLRPEMGPMAETIVSYAELEPVAAAIRFSDWQYLEMGCSAASQIGARLWVNTLSPYHAAGLTDADALANPEILWGRLIQTGVNMIQTDEPEALIQYLKTANVTMRGQTRCIKARPHITSATRS